jgi:hypothetical protein
MAAVSVKSHTMTRAGYSGKPGAATPLSPTASVLLSAYFVTIWGSGFVVTRVALSYAAPHLHRRATP